MKRVCVFLTVCGGALVLAACGGRSNGTMVADTAVTDTASSIPVVETYTVVDATEERMISTFGSLSFIRSNQVTAEVGGTITAINREEGDAVFTGQVLARLENVQIDIRERQAQAELDRAQAALELAQAQLVDGRRSVEAQLLSLERTELQIEQRRRELADIEETLDEQRALREVGGVSAEALEATELEFFSRQSTLEQLLTQRSIDLIGYRDSDVVEFLGRDPVDEAQRRDALIALNTVTLSAQLRTQQAAVALAESEMESVADLVSKLTIRAPVAGLIAQRSAEIGSVVTEGTALFTMIDDSDSVYVIVPVAESDAPFVQQGQAARVFVRSLAEQEFAGVVAVVSPVLDPASGNRTIRVRVDSSDPRLLPGLFARVQIPVGTAVSVPVIPHAAIRNRQDDVAEVLELNGNRVFRREIRIRETEAGDGALLAVVDGLNAGARIVMRPGDNLRDGTEVRDAR